VLLILDDVTTTDELIPSGETSSYRSNPLGLAEYTLSRRDPEYVERAKAVAALEIDRVENNVVPSELSTVYNKIKSIYPNVDDEQAILLSGSLINYNRDKITIEN
jgi:aconitate hydratase